MMVIDAVQYVEQLGAYGRSGHLSDMTLYGMFKAFKEMQADYEVAQIKLNAIEISCNLFRDRHDTKETPMGDLLDAIAEVLGTKPESGSISD